MAEPKGGKAAEQNHYINRDSDQPVYAQLAESLRQHIIPAKDSLPKTCWSSPSRSAR
jgi:hypothetical protein